MYLGVVPARGGSQGIPRKSIALCAGRPLLAWTAAAAQACARLSRTVLSTDDASIAEVARRCGLEAPFLRPVELAGADTPMVPVLLHALTWAESNGLAPRALVLLQPTSPLRQAVDIDAAIDRFEAAGADTAVTVVEVPHQYNPVSVLCMRDDGILDRFLSGDGPLLLRRQDKPVVWARNGPAVVVVSAEQLRRGSLYGGRTVGVPMRHEDSLDIDNPADLAAAEAVLLRRLT